MSGTLQQGADGPTVAQAGVKVAFCDDLVTITADTTIAAGDYCTISRTVEGQNILGIAGGFATLGFWVRSPVTGIHCCSFRNGGTGTSTFADPSIPDRSYIKEYTINVVDTWEFKVMTVPIDDSTGTWYYANGLGLVVTWTLAAGATFQTTKDAWQVGNYLGTSSQVNVVGVVGSFKVAIPNLLAGQDYQRHTYEINSTDHGRYLEKSYNINTSPSTISTSTSVQSWSISSAELYDHGKVYFSEIKRAVPVVTIYNPVTGAINSLNDNGTTRAASSRNVSDSYCDITGSGMTVGSIISFHYTADSSFYI